MNLTALYERGASVVAQAIETSGTTITFRRDADGAEGVTVDPVTLAITDATPPRTLFVDEPAILVRTGATTEQPGPGRTRTRNTFRILLRPSASEVREADEGTITASQDEQLVGAVLRVTEAGADPSGAFHEIVAVAR